MSTSPKLNFLLIFLLVLLLGETILFFAFAEEKRDSNLFFAKINDNGFEFEIKIQAKTVKEVLESRGIEIRPEDRLFPLQEEKILPGIKITIYRAIPLFLDLYGKKEKFFTQKKTVQEFLEEKSIKLKEDDLINRKFEEEVFPGMEIKIWKRPKPPQERKNFQIGLATWYAWIPGDFAASRFFPRGSKLSVTNLSNGKEVTVTINDWGPQPWTGKILDLEKTAFAKIAPLKIGVIKVKIEKIE